MSDLYIPTLHTFAMNNIFTGSCGLFRFKITPNGVMATPKDVDFDASSITAEFWHGPLCYEMSRIEENKIFSMSEDGRLEMKAWLEQMI